MSIKTAITAVLLLSATALPVLAEDYEHDPARAYPSTVQQAPVFGGVVAAQPGAAKTASQPTARQEASNRANAPTQTDATSGSSLPAVTANPHMYDYLSGPEYRGGD